MRVHALLLALVLAGAMPHPARAQSGKDRQQEVEMALDQYGEAKSASQRAAVIDYLERIDPKLVAGAVVDHILGSRNGREATTYNRLVELFGDEGRAAVLDRLAKVAEPIPKGKLIVALRHCEGPAVNQALRGCLDDKRPVSFAALGTQPRRVCDLAYDELYLKLRMDPRYRLDAGPRMKGIITEKMPAKQRDALIARLKATLGKALPSPAPSPAPDEAKPATAAASA